MSAPNEAPGCGEPGLRETLQPSTLQDNASTPECQTLAFLQAVYPVDQAAGKLEVVGLGQPDRQGKRRPEFQEMVPADRPELVADAIARCSGRGFCTYVTTNSHAPVNGDHRCAANAVRLYAIHADLDTRDGVHATDASRLPTREEVLAMVGRLPLHPTALVNTGGGFLAVWGLREPFDLTDSSERSYAVALLKAWQRHIRRQLQALDENYHLDDTADLARICRVPGTQNRKFLPPRPVTILEVDATRRYNPSDFREYVDPSDLNVEPEAEATPRGEFPPVPVAPILEGCAWLRHCRDDQQSLPQPEWYGALSLLACCEDGAALAHEFSRGYQRNGHRYSEAETNEVFQRAAAHAPVGCRWVADQTSGRYCAGCPARTTRKPPVRSPVNLGTPMRQDAHGTPQEEPQDVPEAGEGQGPARQTTATEAAFRPLQPLPELRPSAPDMTPDMLPEPLRRYAVDEAQRMGVPLCFVALPLVESVGALLARRLAIRPKKHDSWTVHTTIWAAVVGRPSRKKTSAIRAGIAPIRAIEERLRKEAEEIAKRLQAELESLLAKRDALKAEMRRGHGDSTGKRARAPRPQEVLIAEYQQTLEAIEICERDSRPRRVLTDDSTIEALGELMIGNPGGMSQYRDELTGLMASLEREDRKQDLGFYLESWNGYVPKAIERIGRGNLFIPATCLSIIGGITPSKFYAHFAGAFDGTADDGCIQRFIPVYPDDPGEAAPVIDRAPDGRAYHDVVRLCESIYALPVPATGEPVPTVHFDDDAQIRFYRFLEDIESRVLSPELEHCPVYESWLAKTPKLVASLALIFAVAEAAQESSVSFVSGETGSRGELHTDAVRVCTPFFELALAWMLFIDKHIRKLYAPELMHKHSSVNALASKILSRAVDDGVPVRLLYRAQWQYLKTPESVMEAVAALEELGWVAIEKGGVTGRPSTVLRINPDVFAFQKTQGVPTDKTDKTPEREPGEDDDLEWRA